MNWKNPIRKLNRFCKVELPRFQVTASPVQQRLARAFARLQTIRLVRTYQRDPLFGKATEERIIWRELLELELQEVDEQIERIWAGAGHTAGE
jgi:hypothetical protein